MGFSRSPRQKELFAISDGDPTDPRAIHWLDSLDQSRASLRSKNYSYFLELLRPSDHWRLLGSTLQEALYLDIETTGLSFDLHYITESATTSTNGPGLNRSMSWPGSCSPRRWS